MVWGWCSAVVGGSVRDSHVDLPIDVLSNGLIVGLGDPLSGIFIGIRSSSSSVFSNIIN